jgi:hypothetical protein
MISDLEPPRETLCGWPTNAPQTAVHGGTAPDTAGRKEIGPVTVLPGHRADLADVAGEGFEPS